MSQRSTLITRELWTRGYTKTMVPVGSKLILGTLAQCCISWLIPDSKPKVAWASCGPLKAKKTRWILREHKIAAARLLKPFKAYKICMLSRTSWPHSDLKLHTWRASKKGLIRPRIRKNYIGSRSDHSKSSGFGSNSTTLFWQIWNSWLCPFSGEREKQMQMLFIMKSVMNDHSLKI